MGAAFTTLRPSLTPGTVCIMLAGRFRGKRVVMLKQLPHNGPIVVTGPFKRPAAAKREKGEKEFFDGKKKAEATAKKTGKASTGKNGGKVSAERLALQKSVDTAVVAALKKDQLGKAKAGYLRSVFTLKPGDKPHRMIF